MRRLDPAPRADRITQPHANEWLQAVTERFGVYQGATDPVLSELPNNQWLLFKNTVSGDVFFFFNDNGTIRKVLLTTAAGGVGPHNTTHMAGGSDAIKLDDLAAPDDNTDLNASTTAHGLLRKLDNDATHFLDGQGNWTVPPVAAHAVNHQAGGSDAIKLDDLAAPDDNTDLNASPTAHGLLPKLENSGTKFLRDDGTWQTPSGSGSGDVVGPASSTDGQQALFDGTTGKLLKAITMSGDATQSTTGTLTLGNNVVTYAKMQDVSAASKLIGRGDSGSGDPQEITLGTGLSMSGTTLSNTGPTFVSAILTATQTENLNVATVITGHTFTVGPGKTLALTGQMIFAADATTTGGCLGVRVTQHASADANAIGSAMIQVAATAVQAQTQLYEGANFNVAAGANSVVEILGASTSASNFNTGAYQLTVKNLATNQDTTVTIEFRSEVSGSTVTLQIGTGCAGTLG